MSTERDLEGRRMKDDRLPEVTLLFDVRGARPENAVGVGEFWYEPEIWTLLLPPPRRSSTPPSAPSWGTVRSTAETFEAPSRAAPTRR